MYLLICLFFYIDALVCLFFFLIIWLFFTFLCAFSPLTFIHCLVCLFTCLFILSFFCIFMFISRFFHVLFCKTHLKDATQYCRCCSHFHPLYVSRLCIHDHWSICPIGQKVILRSQSLWDAPDHYANHCKGSYKALSTLSEIITLGNVYPICMTSMGENTGKILHCIKYILYHIQKHISH